MPGFVNPGPPTPSGDGAYETFFYGQKKMLEYIPCGPTKEGLYLVCYRLAGAEHVLTVVGSGRNPDAIRAECERLNEEQVVERRKAIRDKSNAIVKDL